MESTASLKDFLRESGFKATPARVALLELLEKTGKPLSIQNIVQKLKKRKIDTATIYRSLNAFQNKNIVKRIELQHGHAHYELSGGHHHHITCQHCSRVEDIRGLHTSNLGEKALRQSSEFAKILDHTFELFGVCRGCYRKGRS